MGGSHYDIVIQDNFNGLCVCFLQEKYPVLFKKLKTHGLSCVTCPQCLGSHLQRNVTTYWGRWCISHKSCMTLWIHKKCGAEWQGRVWQHGQSSCQAGKILAFQEVDILQSMCQIWWEMETKKLHCILAQNVPSWCDMQDIVASFTDILESLNLFLDPKTGSNCSTSDSV